METKYKELAETSIFEKRVKDQEIENYKTQLAVANESIDKLGRLDKFDFINKLIIDT